MRRLFVLFCLFAITVPVAAQPYTEIPPFSATEFAREQGVFRWYRGCWWRTVDPNVYLICNDDGTIFGVFPDGTLRQILREDAERLGIDDSGAGNFSPIRTGYDARGQGIGLPYGATAYERYRTLPVSYPIRSTLTRNRVTSVSNRTAGTGRTSVRTARTTGASNGISRFAGGGNTFGTFGGFDDIGATGVYRSDGTSGGGFISIGTSGGSANGTTGGAAVGTSTAANGRIQEILSRGESSSSRSANGRIQEILSRGGSNSSRSTSGRIQEILSRGGNASVPDPNDPLNRPLHIACSGPYDYADGYLFGPIPCTWFPDVFGPVPDYWGN